MTHNCGQPRLEAVIFNEMFSGARIGSFEIVDELT
jgi:hypothetical protein